MDYLLAGLSILLIGDSHLSEAGRLITYLHNDLLAQHATVSTYGGCGTVPSNWLDVTAIRCGAAHRVNAGPVVAMGPPAASQTVPMDSLIATVKPKLLIIELGDNLTSYPNPDLDQTWVKSEVALLAGRIHAANLPCLWIGPGWGHDGGPSMKTAARVQELVSVMAPLVAPCEYIDSLKLSHPGEWPTVDGEHYTRVGYERWGLALTKAIIESNTVQGIGAVDRSVAALRCAVVPRYTFNSSPTETIRSGGRLKYSTGVSPVRPRNR